MPDDWDQPNMTYNVTNLDIDLLKKEVGQRFPFYDMRQSINAVLFFCRIDKETIDENFESLRKSLSEKGYIPMLRYEKGEHVIQIIFKPKLKKKPVWINLALFIATVLLLHWPVLFCGWASMSQDYEVWNFLQKV